jgi:hypothetical protein
MNFAYAAEIVRTSRISAEVDVSHDAELWRSAADVLRERAYGDVRIRADWSVLQSDAPIVQLAIDVTTQRTNGDAHDVPDVIARFLHDAFLLFNVAVPGSFGGTITTSGGVFRMDELTFDASLFEYAWVYAMRSGAPAIAALPLAAVIDWYDALRLGDVATNPIGECLMHLLAIARSGDEWATRVRLTHCLDALAIDDDAVRRALDVRNATVVHPLHDADDEQTIDAIDRAAALVIAALQASVGRGAVPGIASPMR